ncbi:isoaspartyl peptidase/L-asparaginase [Azotobacter sp. CWF10]
MRDALRAALLKGHAELAAGRPALAAVTAAITVLEDDPTFNAGKGAVFTYDGHNELDAAVMDGATRAAGAVAGVQRVRNPILLAQTVMQKSRHVMMVGRVPRRSRWSRGITRSIHPTSVPTSAGSNCERALKEEASGQAHADLETAKALRHGGRRCAGCAGAACRRHLHRWRDQQALWPCG